MSRIVDLIKQDKISFSFEVTPDVTENVIDNLSIEPVFFSVTWHAKYHECKDCDIAPLQLARYLRSKKKHVLLHLSCDMMKKNYLEKLLTMLRKNEICNLFVVLGENYDPATSDFRNSKEMITYIRILTDNYFCIGVAGFPDRMDEKREKIQQLKAKVECGVDFILTQAFFQPHVFKNFVSNCKESGITVPVIPGIFVFESHKQLSGFVNLCKIKVSNDLLELVKTKDLEMPGIEISRNIIQDLNANLNITVFHVFTLNKLDNICNFITSLK